MTTPARPSAEIPRRAQRRADVGLTAFGLAVVLVLVLLLGMLLVNVPALNGRGPSIATTLWLIQSSGMILSFLLGLAAVRTDRGRGWGIAAMVLSVVGNSYLWLLLFSSLNSND
jgi:hypothetical protein